MIPLFNRELSRLDYNRRVLARAEVLADRVATPGIGAEDIAVDEVAATLAKLNEGVNSRQRLMGQAIADARALGVPMGGSLPFGWETHWIGNRPTAVLVRGERVPIVSPADAVLDVLTRAAGSASIRNRKLGDARIACSASRMPSSKVSPSRCASVTRASFPPISASVTGRR